MSKYAVALLKKREKAMNCFVSSCTLMREKKLYVVMNLKD